MAFGNGSVTATLKAKIDDLQSKFKTAGRSLEEFGSKGKRLEDQMKALERRKQLIVDKMGMLERAGQKNSTAYKTLGASLAGVTDKISTQSMRMDEFRAKASSTNGVLDGLKSKFSALGGVIKAGFTAALIAGTTAIVALGSASVGLGLAGIKAASNFQTASLKYETLLGSQEKATERVKELLKFAARTPFELGEIQKADTILQGFGIRSEKLLETVGNAAAISGSSFGDLGLIIGQVSQSKDLENIKQLVERGIISFDELKKAGIKFAKDGSITNSVAQTYGAVVGIIEKKFAGGMDKLSGTLEGRISTLKDNFNMSLAAIAGFSVETGAIIEGSLLDRATKGAGKLIAFLDKNQAKIVAFGQKIIDFGINVVDSIVAITNIIFRGDYTGGLFGIQEDDPIIDFLFDVRETALGLYNILFKGDYTTPVFGLGEDSAVVDFLFRVREAIGSIPEKVEQVRSGWNSLTTWYNENQGWINNLAVFLGGIATGFALVYGAVAIYNGILAIGAGITWLMTGAMTAFGVVLAVVTSPIFLIALAIGVLIGVGFLLWKNWEFLQQKAGEFQRWVVKAITDLVTQGVTKFFELQNKAKEVFDGIVNTIKGINLVQVGKDMIQGLINGIGGMMGSVRDKVSELANLVPDTVKNLLGIKSPSRVLMQMGKDTGEGYKIGIESTIKDIAMSSKSMAGAGASGVVNQNTNTTINKQRNLTVNNYDSSRDSRFINFSTAFA